MTTLFRAFAYQIQPLETYAADVQPEVMVFFEAPDADQAPATLLRLCALAWGCSATDVDYYNLYSEDELMAERGEEVPGDAALWTNGWHHGPTFQAADRTLMFVRPLTATRLLQARAATQPLRRLQRLASQEANEREAQRRRERRGFFSGVVSALRSSSTNL